MSDANYQPAFVLVDDDADDRFFMREAVRRSGSTYGIEEFSTGQAFLDYLQRELNEKGGDKILWLVILDLTLPDIHGIEVLTIMQNNPYWRQVPVIVLSGLDGENQRATVRSLGANDFIVKPSSMDELVAHIQKTFAPWLANPARLRKERNATVDTGIPGS